jgi:ParB/RepB/Spo0J family partition protein
MLMNAPTTSAEIGATILPLDSLVPSPTNPRKRFDEADLQGLASTIKKRGVLQPILARRLPDGKFEIVAGERRFRASKLANKQTIPAIVQELSDADVLEIQVIENLQRKDLHFLEEAEGYQALVRSQKYNVEQLAEKLGKSKEYIYTRLKLLDLHPTARQLASDGIFPVTIATLIARVPHDLQPEAAKHLSNWHNTKEAPTYRDAAEWVRRQYMLQINQAPFDVKKADYFPKGSIKPIAGPCAQCPKRTHAMPDLFKTMSGPDMCMDKICYQAKADAATELKRIEVEAQGSKLVSGKQAEKIFPYGSRYTSDRNVLMEEDTKSFWTGAKNVNIIKALGADAPKPIFIEHPQSREVLTTYDKGAVEAAARKKGLLAGRPVSKSKATEAAAEKKARFETQVRLEIMKAIMEKPPLDFDSLQLIADAFLNRMYHDAKQRFLQLYGFKGNEQDFIDMRMAKMDGRELGAMLLMLALCPEAHVNTYNTGKGAEEIEAAAKRAGIDHKAIRQRLLDEERAREKAKAPKKAARATGSITAKKTAAKEPKPLDRVKINAALDAHNAKVEQKQKNEAGAAAPAAATQPAFKEGDAVVTRKGAKNLPPFAPAGQVGTVLKVKDRKFDVRFGDRPGEIAMAMDAEMLEPLSKRLTDSAAASRKPLEASK